MSPVGSAERMYSYTYPAQSPSVLVTKRILHLEVCEWFILISEPGCSKLTTSLVNVLLKLQTLISNICQYFLLKKYEKLLQCKSLSHFFNNKKKISVFGYKVIKHSTS